MAGGFAEVRNDKVIMLLDVAERPDEIDRARAEQARERAERRLAGRTQEDVDYNRALAALMRALARLAVAGRGLQGALGGRRRYRGAARVSRGATSAGGWGARARPPMSLVHCPVPWAGAWSTPQAARVRGRDPREHGLSRIGTPLARARAVSTSTRAAADDRARAYRWLAATRSLTPLASAAGLDRRRHQGAAQARLRALAVAMRSDRPCVRGHGDRVGSLSGRLALAIGLTPDEAEVVALAGVLHDIGVLGGAPTADDADVVQRRHAVIGAQLVAPFDLLALAAPMIRHHHERLDGQRLPRWVARGHHSRSAPASSPSPTSTIASPPPRGPRRDAARRRARASRRTGPANARRHGARRAHRPAPSLTLRVADV